MTDMTIQLQKFHDGTLTTKSGEDYQTSWESKPKIEDTKVVKLSVNMHQ